jgi:cysteine-rich repeat protein
MLDSTGMLKESPGTGATGAGAATGATGGGGSGLTGGGGTAGSGGEGGQAPVCGDGVIEIPEQCDDGNTNPGDGCSATCTEEDGYHCVGEPSECFPLCIDGILDGYETDVDCGGPECPQCGFGKNCNGVSDCSTYACTGGKCSYLPTCAAIQTVAPAAADGLYTIDPDGPGGGDAFQTFCLMSELGGGWTLLQRTVWDFAESGQLITNYATFYSTTIGTAAPGAAFRAAGRFWPSVSLAPEHLMVHTARKASDGSSCLPLYYVAAGGAWSVPQAGGAQLVGAITQAVPIFNGSSFSTTDNGPETGCVNGCSAVPWTYLGCCLTCPTYSCGYFTPARPIASYLNVADALGNTVTNQCGADAPFGVGGYYADNAMEYYAR